jgi:putative membrane protein
MFALFTLFATPFALTAERGASDLWPPEERPLLYLVAQYGPYVLAALVGVCVVVALVRQHRYRAVSVLGPADQDAVRAALVAAERRTVGEIVPVVVERSDDHPGARWAWAFVTLLVGSALLERHLAWVEPHWLLLEQFGLGACGWLLAWFLPDLRRRFVAPWRATEMAEEQAFQEFYRLGVHETAGRTGVLVFVSLFERRVVVLGDTGIASKVSAEHWDATRNAVLDGIRRGSLRDGLCAAIERCGDVLAEHHPWTGGDRNELADHLVVRKR